MPGLNDLMSPDMQKILLFLLPALAAISSLTMNISRGFSIPGTVFMIVCGVVALYFLPGMISLF